MIYDRLCNLDRYQGIVPSLVRLDGILFSYAQDMDSFESSEKYCTLFIADEEGASIASGWREQRLSNDVIAAVRPEKGSFVLMLPGERWIFRGKASVRRYFLE